MQRLDRALLVVSFGTTHEETRAVTIDAIEVDLEKAFPDRKLYRGWTSGMILRILKKRTGSTFDSVEEALERMAAEGMTDVLVQPTHIITGEENDRMMDLVRRFKDRFERIEAGQPLLTEAKDLTRLAQILAAELLGEKPLGENTAAGSPSERVLVLMGHGSADKPEANQVYSDLEQTFRDLGYDNVYVATVEGEPTLEDVLAKLAGREHGEHGATTTAPTVVLAPLMIVAGDHAKNDMAGDNEDSWKNRFEAAGFRTNVILRGLGEYPAVREMFVQHAQQATRI